MDKVSFTRENQIGDTLINNILIVSAVFSIIALASAQIRAFEIGWEVRDVLQFAVVGGIAALTLLRQKLATSHKAIFLILLFSIGGLSGFHSLGMLAGTVFIFPTAVVVISIFYSIKKTLFYIAIILILCSLIAVKFCTRIDGATSATVMLMGSGFHWLVYIICISFFFAVSSVTIHNYRSAMKHLIAEISCQRDKLAITNQDLVNASKNVKILSGLLPICSSCKNIRDDKGYWNQLECYIKDNSEAEFSHGLCDKCLDLLYPNHTDKD